MFDSANKNTNLIKKILLLIEITRFNRPIGSFLLLWPTLTALAVADECGGDVTSGLILIFTIGTFLMRSAGCVINDWTDRDIDKYVERTKSRPITAGKLKAREVKVVVITLVGCSALLVLFTNTKTILISFIAILTTFVYPTLKRYTHWPQAGLGITFSMGIPMAFTAADAPLSLVTLTLFIGNFFWVMAYDTVYAMIDRDDDSSIGIGSTAILFGSRDILAIFVFLILATSFHIFVIRMINFEFISLSFLIMAFLLNCFLFWTIRSRKNDDCLKTFEKTHFYGLIFLLGLLTENFFNS